MNERPHLKKFDDMARGLVGDSGRPDLYFVSDKRGVFLVTTDFPSAYFAWRRLPRDEESALEDRQIGVIASTEPDKELELVDVLANTPPPRMVTFDDSRTFKHTRRILDETGLQASWMP